MADAGVGPSRGGSSTALRRDVIGFGTAAQTVPSCLLMQRQSHDAGTNDCKPSRMCGRQHYFNSHGTAALQETCATKPHADRQYAAQHAGHSASI